MYGKLKSWSDLVKERNLSRKLFFKWCQLIHALPKLGKNVVTDDKVNYRYIVILSLHVLRDHVYTAQKMKFPLRICLVNGT